MVAMADESIWKQRVAAWRASGQTAAVYSEGKGFAASTLKWWSAHLGPATTPAVPLARVVIPTRGTASPAPRSGALVVEVAGARLTVEPGVDRETLALVVDVLESREVAR